MELVSTYTSSTTQSSSSSVKAPSAPTSNSPKQLDLAAVRPQTTDNGPASKFQQALANLDIPEIANNDARVELNFNQDTGRVVAKITDRASGEILRELPSKELQQLFSQMREYLGSVVDEEI
ncbi:flagellar protein FlaG [Thalassospira lucentensis]|jgi:flagellar protein FlaG|uniref:flagellar protein FlaG n=1 Tax=Thalassospira lucentensis TaxID=168935 RepID=UPI003D291E70|tara:strand:+ start:586 stop:951 length:366 start_codon:yes stop_codon:yes gene_type:complete